MLLKKLLDGRVQYGDGPFDSYILVHCFHGVNRTATLLCSYLWQKLGIQMSEMIARFEQAWGEKLQYDFIIEYLHGQSVEISTSEVIEAVNL